MNQLPSTFKQDPTAESLGQAVIDLLNLKIKRNGRVDTSWGDKTPQGLGLSIERLVAESKGEQP